MAGKSEVSKIKLIIIALVKFLSGLLIVSLLLFVPAGTLRFWNAWLLIAALFVPMFVAGGVLIFKNPKLMEKRLNSSEKEPAQKGVIALSAVMFLGGFIVAGLDFRFKWLPLPLWLVVGATVVFLFAYILYAEVLRENTYLSRTVEVQENQKVVDTGLYALVRHPMYLATLLLFLSMPIMLGSALSFLLFLIYPALLVKRIRNEEEVLKAGLEGYEEYTQRVKYRLIPMVW
ncbi:MAG: isoprenylcysteine carboxylmethyltransferase family protein [Oscillospiraceae bacterium]|jgi:protein-S-isoprenylcysteine O-methyltransferase Ste14|nr:isoprenylcysteine carboxylmethyltransferase family protein [Oscillospiraceae bacterium]